MRTANNLVTARACHASTSLGSKVYVFGGMSKFWLENSIEYLEARPNARGEFVAQWKAFKLKGVTPRVNPIMCPLDSKRLIIYGGGTQMLDYNRAADDLNEAAVIFDTKRNSKNSWVSRGSASSFSTR